jgi:CheY-like chemotaxis protein
MEMTGTNEREKTGTYDPGKRLKVLLVDDQQMLVNLGMETIERYQRRNCFAVPCAAIAFTSPIAALDVLGSIDDLAVVVSDFNMPGMNGEQFLARVREMRPDAIRILASANPLFRDEMTDLRVAHDYFEKNPRSYCADLFRAVDTALKAYVLGDTPVNP